MMENKQALIAEIVELLERMPVEHIRRMLIKCGVCVSLLEAGKEGECP